MKFIFVGVAFVLSILSASAQDKNDAPRETSTSILVNGHAIKGKVLEVDGKHFVAVEDLAQSLRGTIAYGDAQVALTLPQLPPVPVQIPASRPAPSPAQHAASPAPAQAPPVAATPPRAESGNIKGMLTYFFDFHNGNKPDSGSKVWLVNDKAEIPADQNFVGTDSAVGTAGNPQLYSAIQFAVADENGNFELHDIPAGQYTLIMQSAHTKGTLKDKRDFFGRGNRPNLRDSNGRVESVKIVVKSGETADGSKDFGPNSDQ